MFPYPSKCYQPVMPFSSTSMFLTYFTHTGKCKLSAHLPKKKIIAVLRFDSKGVSSPLAFLLQQSQCSSDASLLFPMVFIGISFAEDLSVRLFIHTV